MSGTTSRGRANLPADLTSLVGRQDEISEVHRLLAGARLVTLTGVAGVGKTRLAVAAARGLGRRFPDGVRLVELDGLTEHALLSLTVLQSLSASQPPGAGFEDLVELIGDGELLVVLDNCEHLVLDVGRLVTALLRACPGVRILATSRESLGVAGESVFEVPPLTVGPGAAGGDAVSLFVQRAAAVLPGFALDQANAEGVAAVCRGLDGLPLAIELAAVLLRAYSVDELLRRQDQRFDLLTRGNRAAVARHQTLRAAVDWSFELCTRAERLLWARLSVFRGGFQLDMVETVCVDEKLTAAGALDAFAGLVEKSVVSSGPTPHHYRLLETIRQYGEERLGSGRAEGERRCRDAYLVLVERADEAWFGPEQLGWAGRLRAEHTNLRAVLERALTAGDPDGAGLRIAAGLGPYWLACGQQREGRHWLDRYLDLPEEDGSGTAVQARAVCLTAHLAALAGDGRTALRRIAEVQADSAADLSVRAHAQYLSGLALLGADPHRAVEGLREGVRLERDVPGRHPHLALALVNLGLALCVDGQAESAVAPLRESQEICQEHGDSWVLAWTLMIRGVVEWRRGDAGAATELLRGALRLKQDLGDLLGVALATEFLAWAAEADGQAERAARLFGATRTLFQSLGAYLVAIALFLDWHESAERRVRAALGAVRYERAEQEGGALDLDEAVAYALGRMPTAAKGADVRPMLTRRELQVAELLTEGLSNREIAARLTIAPRTADSHVEHILTKLGFNSRAQVAAWVVRTREGSVTR